MDNENISSNVDDLGSRATAIDKQYWSKRWKEGQTGWDVGNVSTPFLSFFDKLENEDINILIPGCGNGYEGEYLWKNGFRNVSILDFAELPLQQFKNRVPEFPDSQLICQDFFELTGKYDLILEQTFFCALDPILRKKYVEKMYELLKPGAILTGLLFNFSLTDEGPPFGGSLEEYVDLFSGNFEIIQMTEALDSIKPRSGREFWIELKRK